jgi:hypothetical protein
MGIYDELARLDSPSPSRKARRKKVKPDKGKARKPKQKSETSQSAARPTSRSVGQSTDQSTTPLTDVDALGSVVDRPRAFYITQKVDRWLDEGVRYLRERGMHKADRSVLVNALMHDPNLFKPKHMDSIRQRLLAHLTNKSLKRVQSTD